MRTLIDQQLSGGPKAPSAARSLLQGAGLDGERIELLVSEVVTNSVLHGGSLREEAVRIRVAAADGRVRVEVYDSGPGFEPRAHPAPHVDGEGGYGLVLVEALADDWGVEGDGETCVWFELSCPA